MANRTGRLERKTNWEVGVHQNQPLVLVNYGNGEGEEIVKLSKEIQRSIAEKFGVELSPEVNFV